MDMNGLCRVRKKGELTQDFLSFKNCIFSKACQDSKYQIFLAGTYGVFTLLHGAHSKISLKFQSKAPISNFFFDRTDRLWFSDFEDNFGVCIFEKVKSEVNYLTNGIGTVTDIIQSKHDHTIWVSSSKGLFHFDSITNSGNILNSKSEISNQYVYAVLEDKKGKIWISTNNGIIGFNPKTRECTYLSTQDGLTSTEYYAGAAFQSSTGQLYFGGSNGLDVFHPDSLHDIGHAPQLGIFDLKIHGKSWQGDSAIFVKQALQLEHFQNALTIEMAAMEYLDPSKNQFKCRLLGYDRDWVKLGTQDFVTYANLPPGQYLFEFTACNAEGIWQTEPRRLSITIRPPWYETTWFRSLAFLLALATAYALYRYRIAHLQREFNLSKTALENEKKALESTISALLAQMNPHFIFNSLNSINAFILKNEGAVASHYLLQFADLMRQILDYSSLKTIRLDQEIAFLNDYLAIESLRMSGRLAWRFDLADDVDDFDEQIPPMILQPFVENAIWHGISPKKSGGEVLVSFKKEGKTLVCSISDDGIGRQKAAEKSPKHKSKALSITAERLRLFDQQRSKTGQSSLEIVDLFDEKSQPRGTRIELRLAA